MPLGAHKCLLAMSEQKALWTRLCGWIPLTSLFVCFLSGWLFQLAFVLSLFFTRETQQSFLNSFEMFARTLIPIWWCESCGTCVIFHLETRGCVGSDLFILGACFLLSTFGHEWFSFLSWIILFFTFFFFFPPPDVPCWFCLPVFYVKAIRELFLAIQKSFPTKIIESSISLDFITFLPVFFAKALSKDFSFSFLCPCVYLYFSSPHSTHKRAPALVCLNLSLF